VIGRSPAFLRMLALLQRIARFDAMVLIEGETGTGKELAARAIHYGGPRQSAPFIAVNCGALPDHLLENELFGHKRGAYTDARLDAPGLLALAHGGTLFLDEIDSLSPKAQVVLLRVLQDQRFRPLGATEEVAVDVRIIAASNRKLQSLVDLGQFREDLLFRINLLFLALPPLRERPGDAQLIAHDYVGRLSARYGLPVRQLAPAMLGWFDTYAWPGNVRELENLLHREFLLCERGPLCFESPGRLVRADAAPAATSRATSPIAVPASASHGAAIQVPNPPAPASEGYSTAKQKALKEFNERYLQALLAHTRGNVSEAARDAGKERRAFGRLLEKYGISPRSFR
jgi:two-component system response regulator GlrR